MHLHLNMQKRKRNFFYSCKISFSNYFEIKSYKWYVHDQDRISNRFRLKFIYLTTAFKNISERQFMLLYIEY